MLKVIYTNDFLKSAKKVPEKIQEKLARSLELLGKNLFHSLLPTKPLSGQLAGFYSFRITRDWRVIYCFVEPEIIKIIDAAHRKDIYR